MESRIRRTELLPRPTFVRDATLYVVATEGETEAAYLNLFQSPRLKVVPLPPGDETKSAPQHVLHRLATYCERLQIGPEDRLWLMMDMDHYANPAKTHVLATVCGEASLRGFLTAVSNPCFELWLLLHFSDCDPTIDTDCKSVVSRLVNLMGGQGKTFINSSLYHAGAVRDAVLRAQTIPDTRHPNQVWPDAPGTDVGKLVSELVDKLGPPL